MDEFEQPWQESYDDGYDNESSSYMSESKQYSDGEIDDDSQKKSDIDGDHF